MCIIMHLRLHPRSSSARATSRSFLPLLPTRNHLEPSSLHDARIVGAARLLVATLLRYLVPPARISGGVVARGAAGRLTRLLNNALLRELLASNELLRKVTAVHRLRVGVDCIGDDIRLCWES